MKKKIKCRKNKDLCKISHGKNAKLHMNPLIEQALLRLLKDNSEERQMQQQQLEGRQEAGEAMGGRQKQASGNGHGHGGGGGGHQHAPKPSQKFSWYFNVPSVFEVAVSKLADKLNMYDKMAYCLY